MGVPADSPHDTARRRFPNLSEHLLDFQDADQEEPSLFSAKPILAEWNQPCEKEKQIPRAEALQPRDPGGVMTQVPVSPLRLPFRHPGARPANSGDLPITDW